MGEIEERTRANAGLTLTIALNHGGRAELACALRSMMDAGVDPSEVTEQEVGRFLPYPDMPHPDVIIRTGGSIDCRTLCFGVPLTLNSCSLTCSGPASERTISST